ncbi:unnamed protein product [Caenorhabditis sp. 36 PRJEB53466]|nr:unnamed protein product [Caenorhabditis sp. 36 PRJEB53466]
MMYTPTQSAGTPPTLTVLLSRLTYLNSRRNQLFVDYIAPDLDHTMIEKLYHKPIVFARKAEQFPMNFQKWSFHCAVVALDFMKKLDVVRNLEPEDRELLLIPSFLKNALLENAMRAKRLKVEEARFPDGSDVLPVDAPCFPAYFLNRIRCRLVGRLIELKVTTEEFLLVSVILLCNPTLSSLSAHAITVIEAYQKVYTNALLQHCLLTHQQFGPSRCQDLLSLCHVIEKTLEDCTHYWMLFFLEKEKNGTAFVCDR